MEQQGWTLGELVAQAAVALADGYPGAPSARVRDLPDARTVRWYTTRGLIDPPLAMRGRQALYGHRHLLQLVALKRRQAEGVPLARIQTELTGLPDAALAGIAGLSIIPRPGSETGTPAEPREAAPGRQGRVDVVRSDLATGGPLPTVVLDQPDLEANGGPDRRRSGPDRTGSERDRPTGAGTTGDRSTTSGTTGPSDQDVAEETRSDRFWATAPARPSSDRRREETGERGLHPLPVRRPAGPTATPDVWFPEGPDRADVLHGVRLAPGVVLLLDAEVAAAAPTLDVTVLRDAARPLLDLLDATRTDDGGIRR